MKDNVPFFECPDKSFEQIYYFRWWTFRKHLKKTPDGFVFTEFLDKVGHSGKYNTISCALGHHLYEGSWLRDQRYIDEYLDEQNGARLKPDSNRSRYYSHSTFCDLVISGLVGLVPRTDDTVVVDPLVPAAAWDWFCLDNVPYHGCTLTILWDRTGERYHKGAGLRVFAGGVEIAKSEELTRIAGKLP